MKTETIKVQWGMRQEMASLVLLLRDGDYEGQNYASERLMDLADQMDEINNAIDLLDEINNQNQDDEE